MHRAPIHSLSKPAVLTALVSLSAVSLLLPSGWTGTLISLVQPVVPLQDGVTVASDAIAGAAGTRVGDDSDIAQSGVLRENAALRHEAASLSARVESLEQEVGILTATRRWEIEGRRIGARGGLISARVVAPDLLPWRSSRLLNVGHLHGVRQGSPVVSRFFTIDQGGDSGVREGMSILLGETLVGTIEQVGSHTSRAKLLSDPAVELKVRIGGRRDGGFVLRDGYFWLRGLGGNRMEIRDVPRQEVEDGAYLVGDLVLSDPASVLLPAAMTIGTVTSIAPNRDEPLFSTLTVESSVAERALRRVYVFDPGRDDDNGDETVE